jgi:hypothetical protein
VFLTTQSYTDIASISVVPSTTGGRVCLSSIVMLDFDICNSVGFLTCRGAKLFLDKIIANLKELLYYSVKLLLLCRPN